MKININFIFICVFFIALFKNANGDGLLSGLVGRIHNTVHKINEDIHNILIPKEKTNTDLTSDNKRKEIQVNKSDTVTSNNESSGSKIIMPKDETTENVTNNSTPVIASPTIPHDAHHKTELKEATTEETLIFATSSSTVAPVSSTTVKEGRENFAAGCSTGFKRTADGRCKPTF